MEENKMVEVTPQEATVVEEKDGIVKKAGKWIKKNGLKVITVGAVGAIGYLLGVRTGSNANDCDTCEVVIDADEYFVEDAE